MSNKSRRKQGSARAKRIARQGIVGSETVAIPAASYAPEAATPTRAAATPVMTAPLATVRTATARVAGPVAKPSATVYSYLSSDLKKIGIIAGIMIAVLAILSRLI